jgi:hypothetical protein
MDECKTFGEVFGERVLAGTVAFRILKTDEEVEETDWIWNRETCWLRPVRGRIRNGLKQWRDNHPEWIVMRPQADGFEGFPGWRVLEDGEKLQDGDCYSIATSQRYIVQKGAPQNGKVHEGEFWTYSLVPDLCRTEASPHRDYYRKISHWGEAKTMKAATKAAREVCDVDIVGFNWVRPVKARRQLGDRSLWVPDDTTGEKKGRGYYRRPDSFIDTSDRISSAVWRYESDPDFGKTRWKFSYPEKMDAVLVEEEDTAYYFTGSRWEPLEDYGRIGVDRVSYLFTHTGNGTVQRIDPEEDCSLEDLVAAMRARGYELAQTYKNGVPLTPEQTTREPRIATCQTVTVSTLAHQEGWNLGSLYLTGKGLHWWDKVLGEWRCKKPIVGDIIVYRDTRNRRWAKRYAGPNIDWVTIEGTLEDGFAVGDVLVDHSLQTVYVAFRDLQDSKYLKWQKKPELYTERDRLRALAKGPPLPDAVREIQEEEDARFVAKLQEVSDEIYRNTERPDPYREHCIKMAQEGIETGGVEIGEVPWRKGDVEKWERTPNYYDSQSPDSEDL